MNDGRTLFDQPVKNLMKTLEYLENHDWLTDYYAKICLLIYPYFKENYKSSDLSIKKHLMPIRKQYKFISLET